MDGNDRETWRKIHMPTLQYGQCSNGCFGTGFCKK